MENCSTCAYYYDGFGASICTHCELYSHYEPKRIASIDEIDLAFPIERILGDDDGDA